MERSRRFFHIQQAFEVLPDVMLVLDAGGRIVEGNPAAEAALRRERRDLLGATLREVGTSADNLDRLERAIACTRERGEPFEAVFSRRGPGGAREWEVRLFSDPGEHAEAGSVFLVARDVTTVLRRERELSARSEQLTRLGDTLCHDLRSPLVTIRSFLGFLAEDLRERDEERIATDIGAIKSAAERMSELLTHVFNATRSPGHRAD